MDIKGLITELINTKELSLEKVTELELKYNVNEIFIDKLSSDINIFKSKEKNEVDADAFLSYLHSELYFSLKEYGNYLNDLFLLYDLDDELTGEINSAIDKIDEKIKVYEKILGIDNKKNGKSL